MNRYVVLYLATLIVMVPIDFLFLGVVAKGFFASQVGDMLGEIRPAPAILFYLLYGVGILIFVNRAGDRHLAIDAAVWRAIRLLLLRDLRTDLALAVEALDLAGGHDGCGLGIIHDGAVVHARADDRQLDHAEDLSVSFGRCRHPMASVIPGRAKREPGIHNHDREYGFRACAKWHIPE